MIIHKKLRKPPIGLMAVVVLAVSAAFTAIAQTTLQGQLAVRALSRDDIAAYSLPATTELSGGLSTVGVGAPVYLEAQLPSSIPAAEIVNVTWTLGSKPSASKVDLTDSPLTADVPVYEPADRLVTQVAGRKLLHPDVMGQYTIKASVTTAKNGTVDLTTTVTVGTYMGIKTCGTCHSVGSLDKATSWAKTLHAEVFKDNINGMNGTTYASSCWGCHTVGYNTNPDAANGGFDDIATQLKWTAPIVMKAGNWDAVPDALKNVANIQCENCHGPGSQHVIAGGDKSRISVSMNSGDCGQCHGALTHHVKNGEWNNSMHAVVTRDASGAGREGCVGCHTGNGFVGKLKGSKTVNTDYSSINCQTCHEPHGQGTPDAAHQLRTEAPVTLANGTVVSDGGTGLLCMNCHQSRQDAQVYAATAAASSRFGPHHGPQADMLQGTNGFTYGLRIPSSAHADVVEDSCVGCHMQTVDAADASLSHVGGHTFKPSSTDGKNKVELVGACQKCHGADVTTFDFELFDYDNDGVIEGVQTEVQHLLDKLSSLLPPNAKPKTELTIDDKWTRAQLEAAYNWQFVANDGSKGVHNTAYAVGLLKASIANLSKK